MDALSVEDFQAALRARIKAALLADPELVAELAALLPPASAETLAITASGERSVAAKSNSGVISTGDNATIQR